MTIVWKDSIVQAGLIKFDSIFQINSFEKTSFRLHLNEVRSFEKCCRIYKYIYMVRRHITNSNKYIYIYIYIY